VTDPVSGDRVRIPLSHRVPRCWLTLSLSLSQTLTLESGCSVAIRSVTVTAPAGRDWDPRPEIATGAVYQGPAVARSVGVALGCGRGNGKGFSGSGSRTTSGKRVESGLD
jgi:hypothetical protein